MNSYLIRIFGGQLNGAVYEIQADSEAEARNDMQWVQRTIGYAARGKIQVVGRMLHPARSRSAFEGCSNQGSAPSK